MVQFKVAAAAVTDVVDSDVGATTGFTLIVIVVLLAHCPISAVKVYKVVAKLFNAGDQVPEIPFREVVGKGSNVWPGHDGPICVKKGETF